MKNIIRYTAIFFCALFVMAGTAQSQQVSNPSTNLPQPVTGTQPTVQYFGLTTLLGVNKYNYVRTQIPDAPSAVFPPASGMYRQSTAYTDGLGRPMQTVAKNAHADGFDLVIHKVYDAGTGRETYQYLPFTIPVSQSFGLLSETPNSRIRRFYDAGGVPDEEPFSKTVLENSPVSRVTKTLAPGTSWVGSDRGVTNEYLSNIAAEGIRQFSIGNNPNEGPITIGVYAANQLSITKVTDEDGKWSLEYKDKRGLVILKKTRISGTGVAHDGFACTYFVYDNLQKLRYVIPPKAVAAISATWDVGSVADLCYSYYYDAKGRLIEKKLPGKAKEKYVYDKRDRLVFYQDGILATDRWAFTTYDAFNRPTTTGIANWGNVTRDYVQNAVNTSTSAPTNDIIYYVTNYNLVHIYPPANTVSCTFLSYNYYDNYNELSGLDFDATQFSGVGLPTDGTVVPSELSNHTKGLLTGTKVRVINPEDPNDEPWVTTAHYYDDKARMIQSVKQNLSGGYDINSVIYYFQGMPWKNILRHQNPNAQEIPGTIDGAHTTFKVVTTTHMDLRQAGGSGLVKTMTQKIDDGIEYQFGNYYYDHLGRNVVRQTPAANFLNEYNMRGFLNHIEVKNTFQNPSESNRVFEEKLFYDKGFGSKLYNGNIAGIIWRKYGNNAPEEAYGYSYDPLNRLFHAEYARKNVMNNWVKTGYDYTASNIAYDLNGNIQSMFQRGINPPTINSPIHIDKLTYTYAPNSNQLIKVDDAVSAATTQSLPDFKDNTQAATEYFYDSNGNLTKDDNKGITNITYSRLNKPEIITTGQGYIVYTYDAAGNLLRKKVHTNSPSQDDIYDYIGNFVYKNDVLQYMLTGEGRARPVPGPSPQSLTKFQYDYFVKDHLGNVRSTITAEPISAEYLAMHEIATANAEQLVFDNIPNVRDASPSGGGMAARLDGGDPSRRVGTAIMLQVMPGDQFTISADAYYEGTYSQNNETGVESIVESLMGALLNGNTYTGVPIAELPDNVRTITAALNNAALPGQLSNLIESNNDPNAPKAHLNVLFFNDKLELIEEASSITQVPGVPQGNGMNGFMTMTPVGQASNAGQQVCCNATGPGYVVIYVDNQSVGKDVWFDNIMIEHYTGKVQEENHYYPFGLTVQTDIAPNAKPNSYLYNTKELEKAFNLNLYDYGARMQDMQLGRWFGIDPMAEKFAYESPYSYAGNNPIRNIDAAGLLKIDYSAQSLANDGINIDPQALRKFETIVRNVGRLLEGNPQLMTAMVNSTGWTEGQIREQLTFGQGAGVNISEIGAGGRGDLTSMTLDVDMVQRLGMVNPSDQSEYGKQIFTVALTLLHELVHVGDKQKNGNKTTGQFWHSTRYSPGGRAFYKNEEYLRVSTPVSAKLGAQAWKRSLTGHRGTDIEVVGFGIKMDVDNDGSSNFQRGSYSPLILQDNLPPIPNELPQNAKFENIANTLGL